jgi:hypothetical protein
MQMAVLNQSYVKGGLSTNCRSIASGETAKALRVKTPDLHERS